MDNTSVEIYVDNLINYYSDQGAVVLNAFSRGDISQDEFLSDVHRYIKQLKVSQKMQKEILERYKNFLWAYDILEPLVQDPDVTDIHCLSWNRIRIKRVEGLGTVRENANITFDSPKHFRRFVNHLAIKNKVNLSEQQAMQKFVDKESNAIWRLRCNIITDFLTCSGEPFLYIRKERKQKERLEQLVEKGMFSAEMINTIIEAAQGALIVSGETGSGKSKLMNAALEKINWEKNVLVIQADDELYGEEHPDVVCIHTVNNGAEGISYDFDDLRQNAMYLDRQYIIFSEVKGKEARDAFSAAINGIYPWLSLHAPGTRASLYQFANYVKMAMDISIKDVFRMLSYMPFTLIHMKDYRINEITYMRGWDEEKEEIIFEDVKL